MDYALSEQQEMLKRMARDFLQREVPKSMVREMEEDERGHSPDVWRKMAELGWQGLPFPEKYGGGEGSMVDFCVLFEECGYNILPGPLFSTVALAGFTILEAGSEEQKSSILPRITRGEVSATLALYEASARYTPDGVQVKATATGNDYVLSGTKLFVHNAHIADRLVCVARTKEGKGEDGITLFLVDAKAPGLSCTLLSTWAGDKQCEVIFDNVRVSATNVLGQVNQGWQPLSRALEKATVVKCAEMLGGAEADLDLVLHYVKIRTQFGRPIGMFQSMQHHLATLRTQITGARFLVYQAAWKLSEGLPSTWAVSAAKARINEVFHTTTVMVHRFYGGVGIYWETDPNLYYRRAKASEVYLGDTDYHRELVAQQMGL